MKISSIQYISQGITAQDQLLGIKKALDNGVQWVQLRWKDVDLISFEKLASEIKKTCQLYKATFVVNDHVKIAKNIEADGVHLGLTDTSIVEAREILGTNKIIGATANTLEQIIQRTKENVDYIGFGPYKFTTTKKNLSPVLGIQSYENLKKFQNENPISLPPILAVGGIELNDIEPILKLGIYGVALSGLLYKNPQSYALIKKITDEYIRNSR